MNEAPDLTGPTLKAAMAHTNTKSAPSIDNPGAAEHGPRGPDYLHICPLSACWGEAWPPVMMQAKVVWLPKPK